MPTGSLCWTSTIGYDVQQTDDEYIFDVRCVFRTRGVKVKVKEIDGKQFVSVMPSTLEHRKMEDSIRPGADTLGGVFEIPKKADPATMKYKTEWESSYDINGEPFTSKEKGLQVRFKKLGAAPA